MAAAASRDRPRRPIVGLIGGDRQPAPAHALGRELAARGGIVLTGGGAADSDEVKDQAVRGARAGRAPGGPGGAVGVLPFRGTVAAGGPPPAPRWELSDGLVLLHTGLPHTHRNVINGVTPDLLVVFGGSSGTLAEAAFALAAGRPLLFFGGAPGEPAVARLRRNFELHLAADDAPAAADYLARPLAFWRGRFGPEVTAHTLRQRLGEHLRDASDWPHGPAALAAHAIALCEAAGACDAPTGFPGLPADPVAVERFEREVDRLSHGAA